MLRQFLKVLSQRCFKKNIFHTILNLLGLAVGLMAFILIVLFVQHERKYDTFHKNYNSIYRIICDEPSDTWVGTPAQLGPYLKDRVPEIEDYVRIEEKNDVLIYRNHERFYESHLLYADSTFFEVFDFPFISGGRQNPLEDLHSVVISESMAEKYFGDKTPIGEQLQIGEDEDKLFTVTAVVADPPSNSTIHYRLIIPFELLAKHSSWGMFNYTTYVKLNKENKADKAEEKITKCAVDRGEYGLMKLNFLKLQPMKDMHFEPMRGNHFQVIDKKYIFILLSSAIFILLLAVINYTNLSSAIALKRSKEVALKKIAGSSRVRIIMEFLLESVLFSIVALFLAVIMVEFIQPLFNRLIGVALHLDYTSIPFFLLIALLIGILGGIYPAIHSSRFNIMGLLKESYYKGKKASTFRNILVLIQFGITGFLLISSLTFTKQLNYIYTRDLGIRTQNIYEIQVHWQGIKLKELKNELKQHTGISHVTTTTFYPGNDGWHQSAYWKGMEEDREIQVFLHSADKDFIKTFGINMLEGGEVYKKVKAESEPLYILNQSTKEHIGWDQAQGKLFSVFGRKRMGKVIGVIEDIKFRSLRHPVEPSVLLIGDMIFPSRMFIRINGENHSEVLDYVESKWEEFAPPNAPFMMSSIEEDFENLYQTERKSRKIFIFFTVVALFVSLLGLLGLATYISLQRTKEIGIRKVFGSSGKAIVGMLTVNLLKLVAIAFIIACPLAWLYLNNWLENFAYHTKLNAEIFLLAGLFALSVGFISVIFQAWRAATTNPVDSLRYE
jgi:putative ABC transport system permease protein